MKCAAVAENDNGGVASVPTAASDSDATPAGGSHDTVATTGNPLTAAAAPAPAPAPLPPAPGPPALEPAPLAAAVAPARGRCWPLAPADDDFPVPTDVGAAAVAVAVAVDADDDASSADIHTDVSFGMPNAAGSDAVGAASTAENGSPALPSPPPRRFFTAGAAADAPNIAVNGVTVSSPAGTAASSTAAADAAPAPAPAPASPPTRCSSFLEDSHTTPVAPARGDRYPIDAGASAHVVMCVGSNAGGWNCRML